jgi:hypothetical protein
MAAGKVNGWGASGVFPHARIASVRIFSRPGERVPWHEYLRGLHECVVLKPRPKVVLLSLGGPSATVLETAELENHIQRSAERYDINVVVAAGNSGGWADMPGRVAASFTVAASTGDGSLCGFSARFGPIDLAVPGCSLEQAGWDSSAWSVSGTSFAAPVVAGAVAAMRAYKEDLTARQAEHVLTTTARGGTPPQIDVDAALRRIRVEHPAADRKEPSSEQVPRALAAPGGTATAHRAFPTRAAGERRPSVLPRPQARLRRDRSRTMLLLHNRPANATAEVIDIRGRRRLTRRDRLPLGRTVRSVTVRFRLGRRVSPSIKVSTPITLALGGSASSSDRYPGDLEAHHGDRRNRVVRVLGIDGRPRPRFIRGHDVRR